MGARDAFAWLRAARIATHTGAISRECLAMCAELMIMVDSKTLRSDRSVKDASIWMLAKPDTLKRYRRKLVAAGLLAKGQGWQLLIPDEGVSPQTPGVSRDTPGVSRDTPGVSRDTPKVSPHPLPNNYRSTSFSASNDHQWREEEDEGSMTLSSLHPSHRPNLRDRKPEHGYDLRALDRTWRAERRSAWPWVGWARAVLPYLTSDEQGELVAAAISTPTPNLPYLVSVVSRICSGKTKRHHQHQHRASKPGAVPVVIEGRSEDDDAFLRAIS